jgi:alpha-tubulin suppressor-like RCC1 family protein
VSSRCPRGGFTCGIAGGGALSCWGRNEDGELGNGAHEPSLVPVAVHGLEAGVARVSAKGAHACVVTAAGAVKCWGSNSRGELRTGSGIPSAVPVEVVGLSKGVSEVAAGGYHTCALTDSGAVKCWGDDGWGALGDDWAVMDHRVPVDVVGLSSGVVALSAGGLHSCALTDSGAVKCWGRNRDGELGCLSAGDSSPVPVDVEGLPGVVAISAGWTHTCALEASGAVACWGELSGRVPVEVTGLPSGMVAVASGFLHTCALSAAGEVTCWGGGFGPVPVNVPGL